MSAYFNLPVSLDTGEAAAAIEPAIRRAWYDGFERGARDQYGNGAALYTDWRAYGPGATLIGGEHFRHRTVSVTKDLDRLRALRAKNRASSEDDVVVCIRHLTFAPCRHGSDNDPCHTTNDEHSINIVRRYQDER